MSFIRAKEIPPRSGNWYDYEVETIHKGGKVIQKHIRYIGKSSIRSSRSMGTGRGSGHEQGCTIQGLERHSKKQETARY